MNKNRVLSLADTLSFCFVRNLEGFISKCTEIRTRSRWREQERGGEMCGLQFLRRLPGIQKNHVLFSVQHDFGHIQGAKSNPTMNFFEKHMVG